MASHSIEIMILGALEERSMSAYEMDKALEERNIRRWIKISSPSVYRNLIKLCEQGYADGKVVKEGEMPEKTVYTITAAGRERFATLMDEAAALPPSVEYPFLPITANIEHVDEKTGRAMIANLVESHRSTADRIEAKAHKAERLEASATMELYAATFRLAADWLDDFADRYYGSS